MLKNKHKRIPIFIIAVLLIHASAAHSLERNRDEPSLNEILKEYGIRLAIGGELPVKKNLRSLIRNLVYHTIIAYDNNTRIEMDIIKPLSLQEANEQSRAKYIIINGLYAPQLIPYTKKFTADTDCPLDKKPQEMTVEILHRAVTVLLVNATERFVLGVWEDELIKTKAAFCAFYRPENATHYQFTIFQPLKSFNRNNIVGILTGISPLPENKEKGPS